MMRHFKASALAVAALMLLFACTPGYAQEEKRFSFTPYLWLMGVDGIMTVRGQTVPVDVSAGDIFGAAKWGLTGHFEVNADGWGLIFDGQYLSMHEELNLIEGLPTVTDARATMGSFEALIAYDFAEHYKVIGGGRYVHMGSKLEVGDFELVDQSKNWFDPIVGMQADIPLADRWLWWTRFDIGGFNVGSEFTWNFLTGVNWDMTDWGSLFIAYRYWDVKYDDGEGNELFRWDTRTSGPGFGMTFKF
ncbi:hypothetical protein ACFLU6_09265 [Acidobacteriota bacterium]